MKVESVLYLRVFTDTVLFFCYTAFTMASSVTGDAVKFVAVDLIADFLLFPVWWYTEGLVRALRAAGRWFGDARRLMAVGLWAKHLFVPMFAQYDLSGRLISFCIRLTMIIVRSLGLGVLVLGIGFLLLAYLAFPFFVALLIFSELVAVFTA
jgi:hypothetical protein